MQAILQESKLNLIMKFITRHKCIGLLLTAWSINSWIAKSLSLRFERSVDFGPNLEKLVTAEGEPTVARSCKVFISVLHVLNTGSSLRSIAPAYAKDYRSRIS